MNRGELKEITINEGTRQETKRYTYTFLKGEPRTCSSCKNTLTTECYVCEICKKPYCHDCNKENKTCSCFDINKDGEHTYYKAEIEVLK